MYRTIQNIRFFFSAVALVAFATSFADADDRPNILVIMADDMGHGDLSCYGSNQIETPNIDALADAGIRCTSGYVTSTVCAPSRAGLMTGRYQNRFGFEHNIVDSGGLYVREQIGLPPEEITIAERLKSLGYRTACIGKWHLGVHGFEDRFHPNNHGFDYYFGRFKGHGYFPKVEDRQIYRQKEPVQNIDVPYTTDWYTVEAINFIDSAAEGEPWFVYLAHDTPHTPLQAKESDLERFAHIENRNRRTILAMQHCLDENVGRLTAHLKNTGQFENTLIVFLSDNGGVVNGTSQSINAPYNGQKSTFWEGGMRVPMIYCWPEKLPSGIVFDSPVSSLDFTPTFIAAAGGAIDDADQERLDGANLVPYLSGENAGSPHETLCWRIAQRGAAIRFGDWKLVRTPHRSPMLYDLAIDPGEQNNLASANPELTNELMNRLAQWEEGLADTPRWISSNHWASKNRALYDKEYPVEQPD
ncbi:MAG: sulfatase-like hydrolase/transferase [Planctomycetota bacterium]